MKLLATYSLLLILLTGCTLTAHQATELSADQIRAYNEGNEDVYLCIYGSGPPGGTSMTLIVLPKSSKPSLSFSPSCNIVAGKVGE